MAESEEPMVLGETAAVRQGLSYSYSPWDGTKATHTYKGSRAAIQALEAQVRTERHEYDTDYRGKVCTLVYYDTSPDGTYNDYGEVWELRGNDVGKPLASFPDLDGYETQLAEIEQVLSGTHPAYVSDQSYPGIIKYMADRSLDSAVVEYIALRTRGVESYLEAGYQVIQTITTGEKSTLEASLSGVMRVGSPPVPSSAKFTLPAGEWLKKAPQVYDLGHGRFKITQEWLWAEEGSQLLYGGSWIPSIGA